MNAYPRVAFLPDTFTEVNGVAHTARHLEAFARRRQIPLLSIHCGPASERTTDGVVSIRQLKRGPVCLKLDSNLDYDPLLWLKVGQIAKELRKFGAQLIHITGPGDMGSVGLYLSWLLRLPLVMSWHTNLHEYAGTRLQKVIKFAGQQASLKAGRAVERLSLEILRWFYGRAEIIMAPNCELVEFTHALTNKPCHIMGRGVDTEIFHPSRRKRVNNAFQIGYVGRLATEKNVRFLAALKVALRARCLNSIEFVIVGEGSELEWLRNHIPHARFTGVLRGQALAEAFANMDVFVFPSRTDTFGNVVLEALAAGVPTVVTNHGGPKFLVQPGITGFVVESEGEFVDAVSVLMGSPHLHARMRSAAVDYAKEHSWDQAFECVWDVYSGAVALNPDKASAGRPSPPLLSSRVHGRSSS